LVFLSVAPNIPPVPWKDGSLREFVRLFVFEGLHTCAPDKAIEILLARRVQLTDINELIDLHPAYWLQLRMSGQGLAYSEASMSDLLRGLGYVCGEWLTVHGSEARLGVYGTVFNADVKMILILNSIRGVSKCDLLLPVLEFASIAEIAGRPRHSVAPRI
jgi:hypothetical protein